MKNLIIILLLAMPLSAFCQFTQKGFVRSQTFDGKSVGKRIADVEISAAGANDVNSRDGNFELFFGKKSIDDTASVTKIRKDGYALVSTHYIGVGKLRLSNAPMEIIMGNIEEQKADSKRTYENIVNLHKKEIAKNDSIIQKQNEEINSLIKAGEENSEAYKKLYDENLKLILENNDYKNKFYDDSQQKMLMEMADSLSKIDVQSLDSIARKNIELKKAGDGAAVVAFNTSLLPENDEQTVNDLKALKKQQERDLQKTITALNFIAERYFDIAEGYKMEYKNDSAAIYYKKRADLDEENWEYNALCGEFLCEYVADYDEALHYYQLALDAAKKQFGEESEETAKSYNNIGLIYFNQGDYPRSLEYYFKALAIQEKKLDMEHLEIAGSYNNIGTLYSNLGDYSKSLEYCLKALAIQEKNIGKEHSSTAVSYGNIGVLYLYLGDFQKSLEYNFRALAIFEKVLGKEHPSTATCYDNIGYIYFNQGDYSQALEYYLKDLAINEKVFGMEHPSTATSYVNIGSVYSTYGDYTKALKYYYKAMVIFEKIFGKEHPSTAVSYNNIGYVYSAQGDYLKSLEYHQKSLAINEKVLGKEHVETAGCYNNLGFIYSKQGDNSKALEYFIKALAVYENVYGMKHSSTAISYGNIGNTYCNMGDYSKSLEYHLKSLAIFEKVMGKDNPYTSQSYNNIAYMYCYKGDISKSLEYYDKVLKFRTQTYGEDHPYTQSAQNMIAQTNILSGTHIFTATVADSSNVSRQCLPGEYIILQYNDWNFGSKQNLFGYEKTVKPMPKTIVLLNESGEITKISLAADEKMDAIIDVKAATKEELKKIQKKYKEWKKIK